ncbi:endonuclease [Hymenobacter actinosclerus]|uniref:Por secretion system C-terminal sorting domain-containing protein n=1 Tax=Hymenobacter actinosclerus TaxID=82805 RepID=A0A1I0FFE2_9BACT|nr:endonuclease [Hymenobacter actinosclerus]SET56903.1 Por secretion system C-terminal sorting domain-containing protein [Hymenobacter actinosclerus]
MKHFFAWILTAVLCVGGGLETASAQIMPTAPPTSLQGQNLKDWLRQNWYDGKRVELDYGTARGKMYNYVDNQDGKLVCVYSGYTETVKLDSTNTSTGVVKQINCEHTIPQSWFDEKVRMRSDIHHLFPTYITWNSNRGSDPFAEIPDTQTQLWMRGTTSQTSIPTTNIDEYSEDTNSQFEPREDHKGNLARAIFYFYTMHQGQQFDPGKDVISAAADLNTLYQWHMADPVDARERERNRRVAKSQGNFNPYIAYPDLVARAWGFQVLPTFAFATATGSIAEGNSGTSTYTTNITISPAPTASFTVQLSLAATSTATSGQDFTFTSPQTLTFTAGQTTLPVTVTINGDLTPEADETVVLALTNPSTGAAVGGPSQHELTILNDDGAAPTLQFAAAKGSITEGNAGTSTYTVNVTLTGAAPTAAVTIPVTVQAAGTTAATPADYTLTTTSLTFAAGQVNQTLPVTLSVVGDLLSEPNETVLLALGAPATGGAVLGPIRTHELTILNDDVAPPAAPCTTLFFSEYIEGKASNTKAVEIYNPSNAPIDLEGITVSLFANGKTTPNATAELTGTIAPGEVYVIANTGVVSPVVKAQTDLESGIGFFNGDDALLLMDGTDTLDIIGVIGQQPTGGWQLPGGGTTTDATLVRKATVNQGQKRWANARSEWTFLGTDVYDNIGQHSSNCVTVTATTPAARLGEGLEVFPNPATGRLQLRLPQLKGRPAASISLYNMLGQQVLGRTQPLSATEAATLDVQALAEGLYLLRVTADGVTYTSRVEVRR